MNKTIKNILLVAGLAVPAVMIGSVVYAQSKNIKENKDPEPEFIGGKKELQRYLDANLNYPAKAKSAKKEGIVYVSFTVNENGKIENSKVVRSIGYGCDEEALRLVEEMPNWVPGKEDGAGSGRPAARPVSELARLVCRRRRAGVDRAGSRAFASLSGFYLPWPRTVGGAP